MKLRTQSFDKVTRALARVAMSVPKHVQEETVLAAAKVIAKRAQELVPVDSGNLRDSIGVSLVARNFSSVTLKEGTVTAYIGPEQGIDAAHDGYYGHMVEFGTIHMAAQPFMRPAFEQTQEEVQSLISQQLWMRISAATRG